ncbi:MAG: zf-HC2 domain-containing protein [Bacteroidetes bacterium]|nr:zf-HC2 domain-containing protein [Bacteroidota bacterium]
MKQCHEWEELISAYLDGESSDAEIRPLFHHLGTCGNCRRTMSAMLQLRASLIAAERPMPAVTTPGRRFSLSYSAAAVLVFVLFTAASLITGLIIRTGVQERTAPAAYTSTHSLPTVLVIERSPIIQYKN